jgi:hypothetical protein
VVADPGGRAGRRSSACSGRSSEKPVLVMPIEEKRSVAGTWNDLESRCGVRIRVIL